MKNLSLILNIVLLIAVGVLYYLHFTDKKESTVVVETKTTEETEIPEESGFEDTITVSTPEEITVPTQSNSGTVAYINLDEFFQSYEFYKQGVKDIEKSISNKQNQLMQKQKQLEEDFQKYQQAAPTMSENYRKTREEQLVKQEQELYQLRDQLEEQQANEMTRFNESLLKKIDDYLKGFSKEQNYNYVFTYVKGGPASIVYAKDSLDITKQVVRALNAQYRK